MKVGRVVHSMLSEGRRVVHCMVSEGGVGLYTLWLVKGEG